MALWAFLPPSTPAAPKEYGYEVVNTYPHRTDAFTQGLEYHDGVLYESTGLYGQSSLREVELETGRVLRSVQLDRAYFGEGLAVVGDRIYVLTWKNGVCLVYDRKTFRLVGHFRYEGEGWGLAFDGTHLVMSDGSDLLQFRNPEDFKGVRTVRVRSQNRPVRGLNELEYVEGEIWANIWGVERIARIDPHTGEVLAWIDCRGLLSWQEKQRSRADVFNGIAYDAQRRRIFVTGKNWPKLFEIRLVERK